MEQLLLRYGLPGIPTTLTVYLALIYLSQTNKTSIDPSSAEIITAFTISTILIGYIYYQAWFLFFEGTNQSYKSSKRKVLAKINEKHLKANLVSDELYAIWENVLYRTGDKEREIFKKDKGMWSSYHQNKSLVLGNVISTAISILLIFLLPGLGFSNLWLFAIPGVQLVFAILAEIKSRQTFNLIEVLECSLVDTWDSEFAKAVETVVNSRKPISKQTPKRK
ncbi:MAG: hypothetical protein ACOYYU_05415 [Chloroflexota bacterium]